VIFRAFQKLYPRYRLYQQIVEVFRLMIGMLYEAATGSEPIEDVNQMLTPLRRARRNTSRGWAPAR